MEAAASIVGTTSAAVTFVETIAKMVSIARKLHDSATEKCKSQTRLSPEEQSMLEVAEQCQDVRKRLFLLLDRYQIGPKSQIGHKSPLSVKKITGRLFAKKTIKITLRILWDKPEAEGLRKAFDTCTGQLSIHLTLVSRSDILKKIDATFVKYCEKSSTDIENIRNTLQNISKKSDYLIDQVESVELKLDQVVDNQPRQIEHIIEFQKRFEASHPSIEENKCDQILKAIAFQDFQTRRHEIGNIELAEATFEWMIKDETVPPSHRHLKQSFRSWLERGEGIFHITGKPGSGKSTLMNFLPNHPETRSQLGKWARNGNSIVMASVFLWNLGSAEQKNTDGIYRTLLHTILSEHRELIHQVIEDLRDTLSEEPSMSQQHLEISPEKIEDALQKPITYSTRSYQYCFFIDGLDEFHEENFPDRRLAIQLEKWASHQGIKICVSSREYPPWTTYFDKFPRLRIHLTTEQDIRRMIDKYLSDDRHLKTFGPIESERFVSRFVNMAKGVFIWVKLVLRELELELYSEVSLGALYEVLDAFPKDLEEFYDRILHNVDRPEAWAMLNALVETTKWNFSRLFTIYHHSLLRGLTSNPDDYQGTSDDTPWRDDLTPESQALVDNFRKRVPLLFRGMVDVIPGGRFHENTASDWLAFSHRSIYEYLNTRPCQKSLQSRVDSQIMITKCFIKQVNCYRLSRVGMSLVIGELLSQIEHTHNDSMLQVLGLLDEALLHRQTKEFGDIFLDFHSSPNYMPRAREQIPMVFFQSCEQGCLQYLHWAIHNSSVWLNNECFRAIAIAIVSLPEEILHHLSPADSLHVLLGDEFGPNFWYTHPSFSCSISPWTRFLFYFIAKAASNSLCVFEESTIWSIISTFIENNADLDLVLSWTIGKTSASPRRFYLKDIKVEKRVCHDSQYPKTDTLFFKRKKFLVSRKFRYQFPHGSSARELLLHFVPTDFLPLLKNLKRESGVPIVK
ncbi:uncharacterized protein FMAN_00078 [Fusarium mangiferae]|uniref:Nephrocystin 3-like N-terminal domain-containing protein n=1 Tax=Fusarium mangiferae TaxID=192010 RepID=A0A1L7TVJ3_FUSMA|nr:uncharacterized protein FMAN_00078 [Fusarium mangiferae]CVL02574.1 uncharacterized protein FMAN_00078 [Fusarium mangiferae]